MIFQFDPIIAIYEVFKDHGDFSATISSKEYTEILKKSFTHVEDVCNSVKQMKAE